MKLAVRYRNPARAILVLALLAAVVNPVLTQQPAAAQEPAAPTVESAALEGSGVYNQTSRILVTVAFDEPLDGTKGVARKFTMTRKYAGDPLERGQQVTYVANVDSADRRNAQVWFRLGDLDGTNPFFTGHPDTHEPYAYELSYKPGGCPESETKKCALRGIDGTFVEAFSGQTVMPRGLVANFPDAPATYDNTTLPMPSFNVTLELNQSLGTNSRNVPLVEATNATAALSSVNASKTAYTYVVTPTGDASGRINQPITITPVATNAEQCATDSTSLLCTVDERPVEDREMLIIAPQDSTIATTISAPSIASATMKGVGQWRGPSHVEVTVTWDSDLDTTIAPLNRLRLLSSFVITRRYTGETTSRGTHTPQTVRFETNTDGTLNPRVLIAEFNTHKSTSRFFAGHPTNHAPYNYVLSFDRANERTSADGVPSRNNVVRGTSGLLAQEFSDQELTRETFTATLTSSRSNHNGLNPVEVTLTLSEPIHSDLMSDPSTFFYTMNPVSSADPPVALPAVRLPLSSLLSAEGAYRHGAPGPLPYMVSQDRTVITYRVVPKDTSTNIVVTTRVPTNTDCATKPGRICTVDRRPLSASVSLTINKPGGM